MAKAALFLLLKCATRELTPAIPIGLFCRTSLGFLTVFADSDNLRQSCMKINSKTILMFMAAPAIFAASFILLYFYTEGDQVHYWRFYTALQYAAASDVMLLALGYVSSTEPITAFTLWLGAIAGIDKNIFISIFNTLLVLGLILLLHKKNAKWYVYIFILTNFYLIVLLTGAERLKFAYILIVYALLFSGKTRYFLLALSPFAHLQSIILLASALSAKYLKSIVYLLVKFKISKRLVVLLAFTGLAATVIGLRLWDGLIGKAEFYMAADGGAFELKNLTILILVGLIATRERFRLIAAMIPFIVAAFLLGGERVNMMAISVVMYLLLTEGRLSHPAMMVLQLYFSVKSIFFIYNIFVYGDGFAGFLI